MYVPSHTDHTRRLQSKLPKVIGLLQLPGGGHSATLWTFEKLFVKSGSAVFTCSTNCEAKSPNPILEQGESPITRLHSVDLECSKVIPYLSSQ